MKSEFIEKLVASFRPEEGTTVFAPSGKGKGYWVGAPSCLYDEGKFYLACRLRDPERRGDKFFVAQSADGINLQKIWETDKEEWEANSLERGALLKTPAGRYHLYMSVEDKRDGRWRIELLEEDSPSSFDVEKRRVIIHPDQVKKSWVKDPWIMFHQGKYHMFLHCLSQEGVKSTALLTSEDGINFGWVREVLPRGEKWDSYCSRVTSVLQLPEIYLAFYDGARTIRENQEEKTGLAKSEDLLNWERISKDKPIFTSPYGSLRYVESLVLGNKLYLWYEYAHKCGSHELKMQKLNLKFL